MSILRTASDRKLVGAVGDLIAGQPISRTIGTATGQSGINSIRATSGEVAAGIARNQQLQQSRAAAFQTTSGASDRNSKLQQSRIDSFLIDSDAQSRINRTLAVNQSPTDGRFTHVVRQPFVLTCQKWIDEAKVHTRNSNGTETTSKYIYCNVNPSDVTWSFPLRAADQQTLGGYVQHVWRSPKRRNTFFNEPTVSFTFQSGNILPVKVVSRTSNKTNNSGGQTSVSIEANTDPIVPAGLDNFYRFFDLMNQPRVINDAGGNRRANTVYMFYTSRAFPQMTLTGLFTPEGLEFGESAEDPNQLKWTAKLTVYSSFPDFMQPAQMIQSFVQAGFGKVSGGSSATTPQNVGSVATTSGNLVGSNTGFRSSGRSGLLGP